MRSYWNPERSAIWISTFRIVLNRSHIPMQAMNTNRKLDVPIATPPATAVNSENKSIGTFIWWTIAKVSFLKSRVIWISHRPKSTIERKKKFNIMNNQSIAGIFMTSCLFTHNVDNAEPQKTTEETHQSIPILEIVSRFWILRSINILRISFSIHCISICLWQNKMAKGFVCIANRARNMRKECQNSFWQVKRKFGTPILAWIATDFKHFPSNSLPF